MTRLRLAFLGTPDFALPCLEALAAAGHEIACVYCQPPRPAGRGKKPRPSPVQALAEARAWPLRMPANLKDPDEQQAFAALGLDAGVVVAYGLLLPGPILAAPRLGCLNLHASLLPRWRGAAPIQRAILAGDQETGVTIMQLDEGLDTGPMLLQETLPIGPATTAAEMHGRLAELGARMMVQALDGLDRGTLAPRPQPAQGATYAAKLERAEGRLDWRRPAAELERRVRAFDPWPGAYADLPGRKGPERIGVLACEVLDRDLGATAGLALDDRLTIACAEGALRLTRVRRAGRAAMDAPEFLRGFPVPPGTRLPLPEDGP
ncbi:MAG: methionyl-tRNA formyltransferase [Rhodospirillales bacterium]|nr:methionyl-tRNA formyltransferase [Rhodospirillales bacterium]MDH3790369.1 methionyl-tRNA formyltransferase [Rhodospirillales bacterium]MDH3911196.1 methionyl-tRNA formyltransferase [Rhodospirillales bacterium]MDH3917487.1 methionyl-tRNA formyltransferase [Rhodospirillales bacterium]MDH3967217.1 methionyl-tRNA formyltransferase [Rhodospirillales bacterium]